MRAANGWPVLPTSRTTGELPRLRRYVIPDTGRHLLLRDGSAGFLLVHFALWWHERVYRLDVGIWDEWGWAVRPIRGQTTGYSNHAAGCAEDLNATLAPRGVPIARVFRPYQVARIRHRLREYRTTDGTYVLSWGGNYQRTPDGMHVELAPGTTLAHAEEVASRLLDTPRGRRVLAANPGLRAVIES